jgi:hypothetical protein
MRDCKAGDVMYSPEQVHIGENVGSTPTHGIMVELRPAVKPSEPPRPHGIRPFAPNNADIAGPSPSMDSM